MQPNLPIHENRKFVFSIIFIICMFGIFFTVKEEESIVYNNSQEITAKPAHDYSAQLAEIKAKAFFVYDINNKSVLFSRDEHRQLPLASVTKLMSGFVILSTLPTSTVVSINLKDISQEGDSGLVVGEKWGVKNLLDFTLISSSNDGIAALERALNIYLGTSTENTVELMNEQTRKMGLNDTLFINTTGLDLNKGESGAYSSAYDVSMILEKILKDNPAVISATINKSESFTSLNNIKHNAINTNTIINNIPNLIASKTGYTDLAGGNLAVAYDAGFAHPVIVVVLGSTVDERFTDVQKLVYLSLQKLSEEQ